MKVIFDKALSRRDLLRWGAGTLGTASLLSSSLLRPRAARAFPPDPFFENVARMVFHENPWGPHPACVEAIREVLGKGLSGGGINRYDEFLQNDLKRAILKYNGLEGGLTTDNVVLGVGSAEILFVAADAYLSSESPFLSEWPTYYIIHERAAQRRAEVVKIPLDENWKPDLQAILQEAKAAQDRGRPYGLVHFNVINNPMGTFLQKESFDAFARSLYEAAPGSVVLCDDSDREFMETQFQPQIFWAARHVAEGKKMLHIQTFSHAFGLTGMRIGYGIAPKEIVQRLEGHKIFSGVHVLGHAAALAAVAHANEQVQRVNPLCTQSRNDLYGELEGLGLYYSPSQGHYIMMDLVDLDGMIAVLQMYFNKQVFVRWGSDWEMDNWIRVNPGTEPENERFINALKWLLDQSRRLRGISAREYLAGTEGKRLVRAALKAGFPPRMLCRMRNGSGLGKTTTRAIG